MTEKPTLPSPFRKGQTPLIDNDGNQIAKLEDFWSWAYSDLLNNTERGVWAEYIVACAMGIQEKDRIACRSYDLLSTEGIAIEVKSSGYLQAWYQKNFLDLYFLYNPLWDGTGKRINGILLKSGRQMYSILRS